MRSVGFQHLSLCQKMDCSCKQGRRQIEHSRSCIGLSKLPSSLGHRRLPKRGRLHIQENFNLPCDEFSFFCCCGLDLYYCWLTCRRTAKIFFSRKDNLHRSTCFHGEKRCYDVNRIQIHPPAKGSSNVWLDHSHSFARYAESISKLPLIHERRLSIRVYREYAVSPV